MGVHQRRRTRGVCLHIIASFTQAVQHLAVAEGQRGLESLLILHFGKIQDGINEPRSAADRLVPWFDVKGGSHDTGLVMLDVGGGDDTAVDVDLNMRTTVLGTHDRHPSGCSKSAG